MKLFLFIFFTSLTICTFSQNIINNDEIASNIIIFKLKSQFKSIGDNTQINNATFNNFIKSIGESQVSQKFPGSILPEKNSILNQSKIVDISLIYELKYETDIDIYKTIKYLNSLDIIEYAQAYYYPKVFNYITNDTLRAYQYYLTNIRAFEAWELLKGKGDSSIVVGIVDTGVDIAHEDLASNIYYNYSDPIDGIDNDNDGFIDNFRGWDVANNDNNPIVEANPEIDFSTRNHGTFVSGCATARTDNFIGISGPGFHTKFLPIKVLNSDGIINAGYEGIVYAADHGCKIINCSWGGTTGHPYGQDIINYATFNCGALVVAAAGNSNNDIPFYPASYENVLNVAGTNINDQKWNKSCFGITIDISAPGENIFMTGPNNTYLNGWGTSFASPIVAGCAGIVKYNFPNYTPLQLLERIRVTSDNIDSLNPNYIEKLGKGRINLYRALTDNNSPSVRFIDYNFSSTSQLMISGDTVNIFGDFYNYLDTVNNLTINISCSSPYVEILANNYYINKLNTLTFESNNTIPFKFRIKDSIPFDEKIIFRILYYSQTDQYNDFQYISTFANPSYYNLSVNNISTTITSLGRIGYNSTSPPVGNGFQFNNTESSLYEAGLIIANSNISVSNCIRSDKDFFVLQASRESINSTSTFKEILSEYKEIVDSNNFNLKIKQRTLAWNEENHRDYIIFEYEFVNQNNYPITNFYAGIFADWDIMNPYINRSDYDSNLKLAYSYSSENSSPYFGIKALTNKNNFRYALDNTSGGAGGLDISNGFSNEEKYIALSNNRFQAGISGQGSDVVDVISYGSNTIASNDTLKLAFAFIAGEDLFKLQNNANNAQIKYNSISLLYNNIENNNSINIYPNPTKDFLMIDLNNNINGIFSIELFDLTGKLLFKENDSKSYYKHSLKLNIKNLNAGVYILKVMQENKVSVKKLTIQ